MTAPRRARIWHLFAVARILWATAGCGSRSRRGDLALLLRLIRRGHVRLVPRLGTPQGFIIRDGTRIHALYTHPQVQGRGIGSLLLAEAQETVHRLELWTAQSNQHAREFYHRRGFYPAQLSSGQGNDDGQPDVMMIWQRNAI